MEETEEDRIAMPVTLATLPEHPESLPINLWNEIDGVPVRGRPEPIEPFPVVRTIAVARFMMPASVLRLSAGQSEIGDKLQALCFLAAANSIFVGYQFLTTQNLSSVPSYFNGRRSAANNRALSGVCL
jgi:biotin synthase